MSAPGEDVQYDREVAFIAAASEAGLEAVVRVSTSNILIGLHSTCEWVMLGTHARVCTHALSHAHGLGSGDEGE